MKYLHTALQSGDTIDRDCFKKCVCENIVLVGRALKNKFVIPEWQFFCSVIKDLYTSAKSNSGGKVANYIPQLSRFSPDLWGVAVCSIDGQRYMIGDTNVPFCLQSCSKALTYAVGTTEMGSEYVHKYIGQEPSGRSFNELSLDHNKKPHNPMINAGGILMASMMKPNLSPADRFDYIMKYLQRLAGGEFVGFSNATYLSERDTADRNFALAYYMRENNCFPPGAAAALQETLEHYFQLCSIEVTCESGSVMAATLANGGICPTTGERVLDPDAVRNTLSLMHSCGMYDYSGHFAFKVGLPAKSGVSGAILLVVPNVCGIMVWSPALDNLGNSCRGVQFCTELVDKFNFHNYDNLLHQTSQKLDPRRRRSDVKGREVVNLLFSAANGDVTAIRRYAVQGMNMSQADYDGRTALHLGAAEGHLDVVMFLIERCNVNPWPRDRWGFTPLDDAKRFDHKDVADYLESKITDKAHFKGDGGPEKT
ncbi:glutaminase kidney isoform, mitochondrial-like isoform X2 [Ptychodera flava]|uniref:glutaminase kidney isoform, mitochondrial-like isoform X2 n=1 Tax=Ptychodera flava TaxID=63121 RepID=UPI00396A3CA8